MTTQTLDPRVAERYGAKRDSEGILKKPAWGSLRLLGASAEGREEKGATGGDVSEDVEGFDEVRGRARCKVVEVVEERGRGINSIQSRRKP